MGLLTNFLQSATNLGKSIGNDISQTASAAVDATLTKNAGNYTSNFVEQKQETTADRAKKDLGWGQNEEKQVQEVDPEMMDFENSHNEVIPTNSDYRWDDFKFRRDNSITKEEAPVGTSEEYEIGDQFRFKQGQQVEPGIITEQVTPMQRGRQSTTGKFYNQEGNMNNVSNEAYETTPTQNHNSSSLSLDPNNEIDRILSRMHYDKRKPAPNFTGRGRTPLYGDESFFERAKRKFRK